jgi:hypothetical protein
MFVLSDIVLYLPLYTMVKRVPSPDVFYWLGFSGKDALFTIFTVIANGQSTFAGGVPKHFLAMVNLGRGIEKKVRRITGLYMLRRQ